MAMTDYLYRVLLETDVTHGDFVDWLNGLASGASLDDNSILLRHMSDNSVDTPELVNDCLSADAAGRAKMQAGYFAADAASRAKFVDGIWEPAKLSFQPVMDAGTPASFCAHFTIGPFPNAQTIQVAAGEIWTGVPGPAPGAREFISGVSEADDLADFVARVNADATSAAIAMDVGGNTGVLIGKLPTTVLAGVSSHANCVIGGINPPVAAVDKNRSGGTYTVSAADVGFLVGGVNEIVIGTILGNATWPQVKSLLCTTAGGAVRVLATVIRTVRGGAGNRYALCLADGGAILANGDVIEWEMVW